MRSSLEFSVRCSQWEALVGDQKRGTSEFEVLCHPSLVSINLAHTLKIAPLLIAPYRLKLNVLPLSLPPLPKMVKKIKKKKQYSHTEVQFKLRESVIDKKKRYIYENSMLEQETHLKMPLEYIHWIPLSQQGEREITVHWEKRYSQKHFRQWFRRTTKGWDTRRNYLGGIDKDTGLFCSPPK